MGHHRHKRQQYTNISMDQCKVKLIFHILKKFPRLFLSIFFGLIQCKSWFFLFDKQFPRLLCVFFQFFSVLGIYNSWIHNGLTVYGRRDSIQSKDILHLMFRKIHTYRDREKQLCTALPVDKNSYGQKDQCSVKNLDSKDFHLRLRKEILIIQSINQSSTKTFWTRKKRTKKKIHT